MKRKAEWAELQAMFAGCDEWIKRYSLSRERVDATECFFAGWDACLTEQDVDDAAHEYVSKKYSYELDVDDGKRDFRAGYEGASKWKDGAKAA